MKIAIGAALLSLAIGAGSVLAQTPGSDNTGTGGSTRRAGHGRGNRQEGNLQSMQRSGERAGPERQGAKEIPLGLQKEWRQGAVLSLRPINPTENERAGTTCRLFFLPEIEERASA